MEVKQFAWDIVDSNSWLIIEENQGLLVDTVDNKKLYKTIMSLDGLTIILTHSHFDHIIGLNRIRELRPDAVVISTKRCSEYLGNIYRNLSSAATAFMKFYEGGKKGNIEIEPITCKPAEKTFEDKLMFSWNGHKVELIAVHGHTDDGTIVVLDERFLFSGDTLLRTPTVTRFPKGNTRRFWIEDIPIIKELKVITVYPGHGNAGEKEEMMANNIIPDRYCALKHC